MMDTCTHNIVHGGHHDPEPLQQEVKGCLFSAAILFIVTGALLVLASLTGCTKYVTKEIPVILHDTTTCVQMRIDSVQKRDSIYLETITKGDTILQIKYVEKWREKTKIIRDTMTKYEYWPYEIVTEVETKVPVVKEVEKPLKKWQKFFIYTGVATIIDLLIKLLHLIYTRTRAKQMIAKIIKLIIKKP